MKVWIVQCEDFNIYISAWDSYEKAFDFMTTEADKMEWFYDGYDQDEPDGYSMFYFRSQNTGDLTQVYISCLTVG